MLAVVFIVIIGSHLYVHYQGLQYNGLFLIFDNLYNLFLVIFLLFICASFGFHLLSSWRELFDEPIEILLISLLIGIGFLSVIILFLGLVSLLMPPVIGLVLLFLILLSRKSIKKVSILVRDAGVYITDKCDLFSILIVGIVSLFLLVLSSAPPIDWDTLVYHVQGPALFLKAHKIFLPDDNLNIFAVQLIHMLYIPLLAFGNASAPGILSALLGLILGLTIFEFSNRFLNNFVANYSLSLIWASTVILIVLITPRIDVSVALFCFLAHYLLIKSHAQRPWSVYFYLSAILLGCAFGVKYNAGFYILALIPLILWIAYRNSPNHVNFIKAVSVFSLLFFCAISPWLLKNWILLMSPLYPFITGRQNPAWINDLVKPLLNTDPPIYQAHLQIPAFFNLKDFFFNPGHLMIEPEGIFYCANLLFLLLPLSIFCLNNLTVFWLVLPSAFFIIGLNIFCPHSNLRYLIPAIPPLTIVSTYVIWNFGARKFNAKLHKCLLIVLSFFILLPNIGMVFLLWPSNRPALEYFIGMRSWQSYLNNHPMRVASTYADITSYINCNLRKKDKVLFMFEGRGYYCEIPVIQDPDGTNWALLSENLPDPVVMRAAGITYILTNFGNFNYLVNRGIDPRSFHWDKFLSFADRYLEPVYSNEAFVLYRIKDKVNIVNSR
jgi:hypothetical protein